MSHESSRNRGGWNLQRLIAQRLKQNAGQITLSEVRKNNHQQLACVLFPARDFDRGRYRSSRRNSHQQAFFLGESARHIDRLIVGHSHYFIDIIPAQNAGHKPGADTLNFVRRRLAAREYGALRRLNRNSFKRRFLRFDVLTNAGDGPARAYAGNQEIDRSIRILPNFGPGGFEMNLRIRRIIELLRHETVWSFSKNLLSFRDGSLHPIGAGSENNFRTEGQQEDAPLQTHGFGHGENKLVTSYRRYKSQANTRVSAGRFDQHGFSRMNFPRPFGLGDHAHANAILHAGARIRAL